MELIDQSVLKTLPAQQRQKIIRQLRQKQIEGYLRFVKKEREGGSIKRPCRPNKKNRRPNFGLDILLQDAVENFDDKEVTSLLQHGSNYNFVTGNGTSLLHKCAAEDNTVTAGILISHGADVNILDDDWWAPLHSACSCDSSDMVQLLLNNGADISLVDVDGFFPVDHCQDGSDSQQIISKYMEANGIDDAKKKEIKFFRPHQMYNDVQELLTNGGSPNKVNDNGVSLVHIASANGYKNILKLLIKNGADMNVADDLYLTPLHVAAKYNQMDSVKILVKHKADLNAVDIEGNKPSAMAGSNEIRALLLKRERKSRTDSVSSVTIDNDEDENGGLMDGVIIRINSKTVKPRHTSVGKMDSIREGQQYVSIVSSDRGGVKDQKEQIDVKDKNRDNISLKKGEDVEYDEEEEEEDIYVSRMWKTMATSQVKLPEVRETDNLKDLSDISEENILSHIQNRFKDSQIYTKIGDVLIAVNPFKELSIYAKQVSTQYHETEDMLSSLPPHVYCTAEEAYKSMLRERTSQCCVISGESGAGKSETCKLLVQHLARVMGSEESNLNNKINQVTPLLEAFGNAQTVINDNSSRFAKLYELMFSQQGRLVGAKLAEYLLEKSRVVYQSEGERNFHIFYWMFAGLTPEEFNLFHLKSVNSHRYVRSRTNLTDKQIKDNKEKFWDLKKCLGFIGFSSDDVQNLLLTLAAVIHIGDITFCPHGNTDAAVIVNEEKLEEVATMLDVSPEELSSALVEEYTTTRGEQIKKERTVQQAADCRDALAKAIYSRLFSWIVNGINQLVEPADHSIEQTYVGILDIFGFENFKVNSFEQICINLANEKMQNFTNEHLFYKEQQDCLLEGVPLVDLNYKNNQAILDTFMEKHTGVLAILDEESRFPKATDMSLAAKLHQGPGKKFTTVYKAPRDGGTTFTIVHYAGAVSYNLMGTLDKNRDTLPNAIMFTMKTSNSLLIKDLFQSKITRTGSLAPSARQQRSRKTTSKSPFEFFKKRIPGKPLDKIKQQRPMLASERKGPATMAYHFKSSLTELMTKVQAATPHIIRCLKPNTTKSAMTFIPEYVLAQLRYTGISETIKIKKFGFPHRYKFNEFVNRYKPLVWCCLPTHIMVPDVDKCKEIFKLCLPHEKNGYKIGKTKLFLTDGIIQQIDKENEEILKKIVISQSVVRRHIAAQSFKQKKAIAKLEAEKRAEEQRIVLEAEKRAEEQVTEEILKTLDNLEDLLDEPLYIDGISPRPYVDNQEDLIDDIYIDGFSPRPYVGPLPEPPEYDAEMNGKVQYRGLPAPPLEALEFDDGMPPPCPRDMYSQYGVYDVIPGDPHHQMKHKPATPQRSPNTRLSSQISQDEVFDHNLSPRQQTTSQLPRQSSHHAPHSHISHQQQILRQQPTSPKMKQKHTSHPDPAQAKPFSYFGNDPVSSRHRHSEGSVRSASVPNYEQVSPMNFYQNGKNGKPQTGYEYTYPTNYGEPPIAAPHGSPVLQRQSSLTRKASLSPVTKRRNESPRNGNQRMAHGQRGPPSFPAPTAPGLIRPASPPLPPLPGGFDQPPPPPPIEKIPGHQSVSSFELGKRRRQSAETDINRSQVQDQEKYYPHQQSMDAYNPVLPTQQGQGLIYLQGQGLSHQQGYGSPHQQDPNFPSTQQHQQYGAGSPWQQQQQQQQHYTQQVSSNVPYMAPVPPVGGGLADQLNTVKLKTKKSGSVDEISSEEKKANKLAAELGMVKLKTVKPKETISSSSVDKTQDMSTVILPKLKPTGAKPWEKDISPQQAPQQDDIDNQFDDDYFPPPPPLPDLDEIPPPIEAEPVSRIQPMPIQQQKKKGSSEPSLSKMADFDIDLNNIDYSQIPGYIPITAAVPNWKKDMIEKKNQEKVEQYIEFLKRKEMQLRRQKEEAEKWKNVPEWKRKILVEKAAMKSETDEQFAIDEAKRQKEKKERKFCTPHEVQLKPVKPKTGAQPTENITEPPIPEPKQEVTQPLQEIKQNIPNKQPEVWRTNQTKNIVPTPQNIPNKQPEVWRTNQTKNIVPTPADINNLPPPPPMVVEKPKKIISVPEPDLPPPPPLLLDVEDEDDREDEMRRREERRRQIEAESNEEDSGDLPAWKKEIMMKRGGTLKNWGDEREDINETE